MPTLSRPRPTFVEPGAPSAAPDAGAGAPADGPMTVVALHRRAIAMFWDTLATFKIAAFTVLIGLLIAQAAGVSDEQVWSDAVFEIAFAASIMVWLVLYPIAWHAYSAGQYASMNKIRKGRRIVRLDGRVVALGPALLRALVAATPWWLGIGVGPLLQMVGTPGLLAAGVGALGLVLLVADLAVAPCFGAARRTLHDRIAGTVAVEDDVVFVDESPRPITGLPRGADQLLVVILAVVFSVWMATTVIADLAA